MKNLLYREFSEKEARLLNPLQLALIGDGVYEVFIRNYILSKNIGLSAQKIHVKAIQYVKAKAQSDIINAIESELTEDELFEEYLSLAEEIAMDIEEYVPEGAILDIKAYKWDQSDNGIKLVIIIAPEDVFEVKLRDIMKRLITQVE